MYKAELIKDKAIQESVKAGKKFGFIDKVKNISELPPKKVMVAYLKKLMKLNEVETGMSKPVKEKTATEIEIPKHSLMR